MTLAHIMKNTQFQIFKLLSLFLLVGMTHPAVSRTGNQKPQTQVVDLRQVTTHPDIDLSPRVSPDGKWIAYVSRQSLNFDIWIRSTSGGRPRQITKHKADDYYPTWGPKSKSIIFVSQRSDAAGDIWRVRLRKVKNTLFPKGKPERLTNYIGMDGYPTVSPDGKKIAWVSDRSGREEIWFHNDNTGKIAQLTFRGATHPCWSPNIELIAFTSFRAEAGNNGDIWIMNLHGRKPYTPEETKYWDSRELPMWQITKGKAIDGFPSWSPDAKKIVFLRNDKDTNGDGVITPADRASLWSVDVFEEPSYAPLTDDPILRHLGRSFNLSMIRYAMPITSGAERAMQPWFGADDRIYLVSDRRGNLDIWSLPAQGYIPDLSDAEQQVRLAQKTYPLPSRMTRQTLGPLFLDWNPSSLTKKEQQIVWDRALAFRRVLDFHGSHSDMAPLALYEMGVCYALLGYDDLARNYLNIILQSFADHPKQAAYTEMVLLGLKAKKESSQTLKFKLVDEGLQKIITSYGDEHEPAAAALIAKGDLLFKRGEPALAFGEYNKVLKNFPDQKSACAESQLKIGDVSKEFAARGKVVNAYLSVVKNYPGQREWMIPARNRILDLLTKGKTTDDDLIATYREITGRYSGFPLLAAAAQMRIARLLFASDDYGAALGEFDVIQSLYPNLTDEVFESQMAKSRVLFKMGQNLQAFTLLDNLVAQFQNSRPDLAQKARKAHLSSLLAFADELKRQHDYQLAREQYRKAMRMVPRSIHAHRGYIECSYYLHKIDDVIAEYKKLDPFHSKNNIMIFALGLAYSYKATEKAELKNDPGAINPAMLHNSSRIIAIALSYDYTLVEAYLTISYNYEMMENYLDRQRALPKPFLKKAWQTITAPAVSIYHTLTFYEETKPPRYYERAIHELTKAISLNDEEKDPRLEANIALNLANNYYNLGEFGFNKAYEYYHVKLKYDSTFTDKQREALIYERMGHCALFTGDFARGPEYLMHAISLYDEFGNETKVWLNTKRLALLYETANENDMAIEYYQKAADIERRKKMLLFLMRSYRSIAYNYLILDEYKDAILYAQKALDIIDSGKIKEVTSDANRVKIGFLGLYFPVPFFSLSSMGASSGGQLTTDEERAFTFTILGEGYEGEKEYSTAIDYFNKKTALFKKRKDYNAVATFLNNIAVLYFLKADYKSSWDYFLQSLEICEDKKIQPGIFSNSLNLSKVFVTMSSLRAEDQDSVISEPEFQHYQNITAEKLNRALSLTEKDESLYAKNRSRLFLQLAETLLVQFHSTKVNPLPTDIGKTLQSIKNASLAQVYIEEALRISKKYKLNLEQCQAHFALGTLAANYDDAEKAYVNLSASRRLALQNGFNNILWQADTRLGDLVIKMDNQVKRRLTIQKTPFEFYSEAIRVLEAHSGQSNHIDLQSMRAVHQVPYRRAISYLAGKGDYTGALVLSEQMRAKHFLDILDNENIELRKERHKIYFGNARFLQQNINDLEISLLRARNGSDLSPEKIKEQKQQLKSYRQEYEELLAKIRKEVPDLESLVRVNPVSYSRIQKLLRNNEGLLTFVFLQNNTLAWFITPTKIHFSEIKVAGDDFLFALKKITGTLEKNSEIAPASGSVFQQLFSDLKDNHQLKRVVLIPDESALLYPWDAILKSALPQKDSLAIVVSTSFTDYNYSFQNRRLFARQVFLGGASRYADLLRKNGYSTSLPLQVKNTSFSEQMPLLSVADMLHLHVKGKWNNVDPLRSQISFDIPNFAPAVFTPIDLYRLSLNASLVHLDFTTSLESSNTNDPFIAMKRAFTYSGAPSILLSLWPENRPEKKSTFYEQFYKNLEHLPAAEALSQTKRELRSRGFSEGDLARYQLYGFGGMTSSEERLFASQGFEGKVRIGLSAYKLGEWNDAIDYFEEAYQMAARSQQPNLQKLLLQQIFDTAINGSLWSRAIDAQKRLNAFAEKENDLRSIAQGYNNLAFLYAQNRQFTEAAEYTKKYSRLAERYGLGEEQAKSFRETGIIFERGGNYQKAIELYQNALEKYQQLHLDYGTAQCLRDIGRVNFSYLDNYAAALDYLSRSLKLFRTHKPDEEFVDALHNLGLTFEKIGNYSKALQMQNEALKTAKELKSKTQEGLSYQYLANVSWKMGDFQAALENQNKALDIFSGSESKFLQVAYSTRGLIALSLGDAKEAMNYELKALELAVQNKDKRDQATIQKNIGMIHRTDKRPNQALLSFEHAAAIDSSIGSHRGLAYDLRNIASVQSDLANYDEAASYCKRALALSKQIGDWRNEVQSLLVLGRIEFAQGKTDSARSHLLQVTQKAGQLFMPDIEWRAYKTLAEINQKGNDNQSAIQNYKNAVRVIEGMRSHIKVEEYASGFIDDKLRVYDALVSLLVTESRAKEALDIVERAKSRSFLDLLGNRGLSLNSQDKTLLAVGDSLRSELAERESELQYSLSNKKETREKLLKEIVRLKSAYSQFLVQLRETNPELSDMTTVEPWPIEKIQAMLPDSVALLEYYATANRLFTWVVTSHTIKVKNHQIEKNKISESIFDLRNALSRQLSVSIPAQKLYNMLIADEMSDLQSAKHLIFVPHAQMHYLPFAVLQDSSGQYLGMKYSLSLAPSATVLGFCLTKGDSFLQVPRKDLQILAFANPDLGNRKSNLPFAEKEATSLKRYFPDVKIFSEKNATETHVYEQSAKFQQLLFSCHGVFDDKFPLLSSLLLAPDSLNDGRLEAHEIFGLKLNAFIVAMSACETGLGKVRGGDEVIGLSRSFIYAGASSLMSSLWKVDDLATAVLVKRFFRYLAEGRSRAEALKMAQKVVYNEINPYPAFWAAFTITGDFR